MKSIIALSIFLMVLSSAAFGQNLYAECGNCNPTVYSTAVQLAIDDVLLDPANEGLLHQGDRIKIRNVDGLSDNGEPCQTNCDVVGVWIIDSGDPNGVSFEEVRFNDGGAGSFVPTFLYGGSSVSPTILTGGSSEWSFSCKIGTTPVNCATGEPL